MIPRAFSSSLNDASFVRTPRGLKAARRLLEQLRLEERVRSERRAAEHRRAMEPARDNVACALDVVTVDRHRTILVVHQNAPVEGIVQRPIRLVVRDDDLKRSRLTVFFRLILAIPVLVWVVLRGIAAFVVGFVNWLAVLIQGEVPDSLHDFVASYIRYSTQVSAYVFLAADPYPWFRCQEDYPVDLEVDPPVRQGRWGGFFRLLLAVPALLLATALGGGLHDRLVRADVVVVLDRLRGRGLVERLVRRRRGGRGRRPRMVLRRRQGKRSARSA